MALKNTLSSYGFVSKNFHWIMTFVILLNFSLGFFMGDLDKGPLRFFIFNLHKSLGILIIILIILRLFWRLINLVPTPLSQSYLLNKLSKFVHYFFYFILLVVTFSGWTYSSARGGPISVFGLFSVPALVEKNDEIAKIARNIHTLSVYVFIIFVAIHILASLYHHYFLKDKTLKRMWFERSN
ncbi:cytochrome b [Candidatus Pelagibacterales bacterium]|nr:cytochrome b [Pelagibacterales bacterium]